MNEISHKFYWSIHIGKVFSVIPLELRNKIITECREPFYTMERIICEPNPDIEKFWRGRSH